MADDAMVQELAAKVERLEERLQHALDSLDDYEGMFASLRKGMELAAIAFNYGATPDAD